MDFLIDKQTAREWIAGFHAKNEYGVSLVTTPPSFEKPMKR